MDKVLFVDDYAVGCRKDLNGILLLDTALQPPVGKAEDLVHLELPVTEVRRAWFSHQWLRLATAMRPAVYPWWGQEPAACTLHPGEAAPREAAPCSQGSFPSN